MSVHPPENVAVFMIRELPMGELEATFFHGIGRGTELASFARVSLDRHDVYSSGFYGGDMESLAVAHRIAQAIEERDTDYEGEILVLNANDCAWDDDVPDFLWRATAEMVHRTDFEAVISEDLTEIVSRMQGSISSVAIHAVRTRDGDKTAVWSIGAAEGEDWNEDGTFFARAKQVRVQPVRIQPEWSGKLPSRELSDAFGLACELLELPEKDQELELGDVNGALGRWFLHDLQPTLQDPFVDDGEEILYGHACEAPIHFSAGDEETLKRLVDAAMVIEAGSAAREPRCDPHSDSVRAQGAFLTTLSDENRINVEVNAAHRDTPAVIHADQPLRVRTKAILNEIVAWMNPRGSALQRYLGNRKSMGLMGPARRVFDYRRGEPSAHETLMAVGALSAFLEARNYSPEIIDTLLNPPAL